MPMIMFGFWSGAGNRFFHFERIYRKGKWTPFVIARFRYRKVL